MMHKFLIVIIKVQWVIKKVFFCPYLTFENVRDYGSKLDIFNCHLKKFRHDNLVFGKKIWQLKNK
jgi:hypothetical protein